MWVAVLLGQKLWVYIGLLSNFVILGTKLRVSFVQGKQSTSELHPQFCFVLFNVSVLDRVSPNFQVDLEFTQAQGSLEC